jgi:2-polyprenyl-6-methoxyphenol hydroxylase-like FAD-dependent oxidoreductase
VEVGICGGGIAGLACATFMARAGWRVTVFDRLDAPAPVGSGLILQPVGLAVLDELGLADRLRAAGAPITRLYGLSIPSRRVVLDVRYAARGRAAPHGLGVHRGALFDALYTAACAAGVVMEMRREIVGCDDRSFLFAHGARSARFDLAIDALGVRSPLRARPGRDLAYGALWANVDLVGRFDPHALEQRYERAHTMAGVLPIGGARAALFWSLKGEHYDAWRSRGLGAWREEALALWPDLAPLLDQIGDLGAFVFARYAHGTMRRPWSRGLVHVGDCAHAASPQLGQGANMALLDALALARALAAHRDAEEAVRLYARLRRWHVRLYQAASWMFTPAYQSDSALIAWVRDWLIGPISRVPPVPTLLAALVAGELGAPLAAIGAPARSGRPTPH